MADFSTQVVDSLEDTIVFVGMKIPVGFLTTFRKRNHAECEPNGFKDMIVAGRRSQTLCFCAVNRAVRNYNDIGSANFEKHAAEWLTKYKHDLEKNPQAPEEG